MNEFLKQALRHNQYDFADEIVAQFTAYLELLQHWNRAFNLTAIRDPQDMVMLHLLDSLAVQPFLHGNRILDVGTGAGLPGIPLALINPDKEFVLLDSNSKKTRFLTHVIHELKIKNVSVFHERCENFQPEKCFDTIVSRAFAAIKVMLTTTQHLVCEQGQFLAMKGQYPEEEITAMPDHFKVLAVHELKIKGLDAERHLVCIAKE